MSVLRKKSVYVILFILILYSVILIYAAELITENSDKKIPKEIYQNSGQLSADFKWIKLPLDKKSRYGGLIFNKFSNNFVYVSQNGLFVNISKSGETSLNQVIPKIDVKNHNNVPKFIEIGRLGVRNLYFDEYDKSYVALVSEFDEEKNCHFFKIILLSNKSNNWKKIDTSTCWDYGTSGSIGGGLVKDKNNIFYSTGFNNLLTHNIPKNLEKKIQKDMLGKIFKYDMSTMSKSIYAEGFRNPLGLAISNEKKLYEIEMGPQGGDEINLIEENGFYGYPYQTLGVDYGKKKWPLYKEVKHKLPLYSFLPSAGPSSISFDESIIIDNLIDCVLLMTTLRDESLYLIKLNQNCSVIQNVERLKLYKRLRRVAVSDGNKPIYAVSTDGSNEITLLNFK
ncbi:PQQ-dependent sugar dehydrogenase [Methylophilaceae bacterium Uisw_097]